MKKRTAAFSLIVCLLLTGRCFAGICCERKFYTKVTAPANVPTHTVKWIKDAAESGLTYHGPLEAHCPIMVYVNRDPGQEYLLDCTLTIMPSDKKGGHYILPIPDGEVNYHILTARLVDPHHGNAVVISPEKVQWHGAVNDAEIQNPTGGSRNLIQELILSMRPFDDKIYEYEGIPQTCTIHPNKEEIEGGEIINIEIKDLNDHKGQPAKYFQRIMVKVNIGKIKNGVDKHPYYVFEVGNSGSVNVVYQAPEKCDFDTEIITVYNSCNTIHDLFSTVPEDVIGNKEIKVDDFQPVSCKITPEKDKLEPGSVTTVKLTDFKEKEDRDLRPEEKIMVKVKEGKIQNGKKYGEYHLFTIGNGLVRVEYEAPDICDLDADEMIVKNVCEDPETGSIEPDKEIAKTSIKLEKTACDLSVHIKAAFQWKDDQSSAVIEGNAWMEVKGGMKFDDSIQLPYVKRYIPQNLVVSWSKKVKSTEKDPAQGCPELLYEYMGGGASGIPDPAFKQSCSFETHRFGDLFSKDMPIAIPAEARSQMVDSFFLVLPGVEGKMRGKYRTGTYCGDNFCPCKKYKDKESEIGVGTIFIRGKMDKDLTMKGNRYWVAHGASFSGLNFTIDYVGDKPVLKPKPLDKVGKSILNVTVSWEFKASRQD